MAPHATLPPRRCRVECQSCTTMHTCSLQPGPRPHLQPLLQLVHAFLWSRHVGDGGPAQPTVAKRHVAAAEQHKQHHTQGPDVACKARGTGRWSRGCEGGASDHKSCPMRAHRQGGDLLGAGSWAMLSTWLLEALALRHRFQTGTSVLACGGVGHTVCGAACQLRCHVGIHARLLATRVPPPARAVLQGGKARVTRSCSARGLQVAVWAEGSCLWGALCLRTLEDSSRC